MYEVWIATASLLNDGGRGLYGDWIASPAARIDGGLDKHTVGMYINLRYRWYVCREINTRKKLNN